MVINKIVSGWLVLTDGENKNRIALQRRSIKNKTFPFVCQATWSGKVELGEEIKDALLRECREELGDNFYNNFDFSSLEFISTNKFIMNGKNIEVSNYCARVSQGVLNTAKLHEEAFPDFIFVDGTEISYFGQSGKDPKNNIVLFEDQYKILSEILNKKWN